MNEDMFVRQARAVLDFNWTGEYTMPGPRLYPHQWSWDSALIAIGYSRYDQERATRELRHLFEAQWKNGLLPQLVFNPISPTWSVRSTNFCSHREWLREGASDLQGAAEPDPEPEHLVEAVAFLCVEAVQGRRDLLLCGSADII